MKELLLKYGFKQSEKNVFYKPSYVAIVWATDETATITKYTPKVKRFLSEHTYKTLGELEKELIKNHK